MTILVSRFYSFYFNIKKQIIIIVSQDKYRRKLFDKFKRLKKFNSKK